MMWPPKNLKQALIPILILNWLTGLGPVKYPVGNSRKNVGFIFVLLIVTSLWLASAIFQLNSCASADAASLDVMVFTMLGYFNTLTASLSLIIGWYFRKRMQLCMQRIELMDEAFESLGMERKYRKIFVKSLIMSIIWLTLMCSVYFADVYLHLSEMDLIKSMCCTLCFQWPIHTNTVVNITFISTLSCLGSKFKKINSLLWKNSKRNTLFKIVNKRKRIQIIAKPYDIYPATKKISFIEMLKHLHLELSETTKEINQIYKTQITMEMATNFVSITAFLFYFRNALNLTASSIEANKIKNMMALTLWGTIYFLRFFHLNIAAEIICAEVRKTGDTVLELKQTKKDTELVEEMEQFTLQLTQYPSLITIHGFKSLGKKFVIQFLGEVTTYLVILIQMRSRNSNS